MKKLTLEEKQELYAKMLASCKVDMKGKNNLYTSLNGNMYSFVGKDGMLAVRLSKDDKEKFEKKHKTKPVIQYGAVMNGYVEIPDKLAGNMAAFKKVFQKSYAYAETLKKK